MKKLIMTGALVLLMSNGPLQAAEVIERVPDTLPGKGYGAASGFMAGTATGGPAGGIIGAVGGWWLGHSIQRASGLHGTAYLVKEEDGSRKVVRSPGRDWEAGDKVEVVGRRLVEAGE